MQTKYWVNKLRTILIVLFVGTGVVGDAYAHGETSSVTIENNNVHLAMADGTAYGLNISGEISAVFYDKSKHKVEDDAYVSLFQVLPSNSGNPTGLCGAGSEIWLYVYQVKGAALKEKITVLVSSCLHSISLASQNSGEETQAFDFSSVQWSTHGFSIKWFEKMDAAGQPVSATDFVMRNGVFSPRDVLIQENN
jgi:hypothetical protein